MKKPVLTVFLLAFTASLAMADGDGPTRPMNRPEAAAFNELQKTVKAALPADQPNYKATFSGFDKREIYEKTTPEQMCSMAFTARFALNPGLRESSQQAALMDLTKGSLEQQAKRADLVARADELKQARKKTRDSAEKERIRAELKKINAEENALNDEIAAAASKGGWNRAMTGVDKSMPAKELSIRVLVNQNIHVQDIAKPYQVSGAPLAFEQRDKCQDSGTSCITVLLGNFVREKKISGTTQYTLQNATLGVPTKPRGMALIVAGSKNRPESARNLLKQIDIAKLQALLP